MNNTAERAICPKVLWRKERLDIQSVEGSRFIEAIMTAVEVVK